ncbi:MAG: sigma-54 interaction domain-containing protein, partial [bacterium]
LGAEFYSAKTEDIQTLKAVIDQEIRTLPWRHLCREQQTRKYGTLIGDSRAMQKIRQEIGRCAGVDFPVLITGESGTGKELVANAIHRQSKRAGQAMFTVNCSTLAPHLFESEFFGHERGAFTGAYTRKKGKFELANLGTLFLDEIADLPIESQPKLLETLEYQRFQRVGGEAILSADVRIIAATNKDLKKCIEDGCFREDLYYRLKVVQINVPPLRERAEDIPELAGHFLELACREIKRPPPKIPPAVMHNWQHYHWPGNVRELRHKMMHVALYSDGDSVGLQHLLASKPNHAHGHSYIDLLALPYPEAKQALFERFQADYIREALRQNHANITKTAEEIGVHRSTVHRVLKNGV